MYADLINNGQFFKNQLFRLSFNEQLIATLPGFYLQDLFLTLIMSILNSPPRQASPQRVISVGQYQRLKAVLIRAIGQKLAYQENQDRIG